MTAEHEEPTETYRPGRAVGVYGINEERLREVIEAIRVVAAELEAMLGKEEP